MTDHDILDALAHALVDAHAAGDGAAATRLVAVASNPAQVARLAAEFGGETFAEDAEGDLQDRLETYAEYGDRGRYEFLFQAAAWDGCGLRESLDRADAAYAATLPECFGDAGSPWTPYTGPRGGRGWKNAQTGRVYYGQHPPSRASGTRGQRAVTNWHAAGVQPGSVTREHLHAKLQPHVGTALNQGEQRSAARSYRALRGHHGRHVLHRLNELIDADSAAHHAAAGPRSRRQHAKRLAGYRHMLDLHRQEEERGPHRPEMPYGWGEPESDKVRDIWDEAMAGWGARTPALREKAEEQAAAERQRKKIAEEKWLTQVRAAKPAPLPPGGERFAEGEDDDLYADLPEHSPENTEALERLTGRLDTLADHGDSQHFLGLVRVGQANGHDLPAALDIAEGIYRTPVERLLSHCEREGVAALDDVARAAVARLLAAGPAAALRAQRLFSHEELARLAESLAAGNATAELLGRASVRGDLAAPEGEDERPLFDPEGEGEGEDMPTPLALERPVEAPPAPGLAETVERLAQTVERLAYAQANPPPAAPVPAAPAPIVHVHLPPVPARTVKKVVWDEATGTASIEEHSDGGVQPAGDARAA